VCAAAALAAAAAPAKSTKPALATKLAKALAVPHVRASLSGAAAVELASGRTVTTSESRQLAIAWILRTMAI
jgi:hypothetical protein